jgi:NAD(P)-dependent dehydrogenase (short-subunit alcohol dehydrogenase family)
MAISDLEQTYGSSPDQLAGRVVVVTGGTRGIGAAISRCLSACGATVAAAYGTNHERAEEFQSELALTGKTVSIHRGDIGSAKACQRIVREVLDHHGQIDALVNNAGITSDGLATKMAEQEWRRVIDTNLSGPFFMCKEALGPMVERGFGRIVNISSIIGQMGNIGPGITVNAVAPGFIETEMLDTVPPKVLDGIRAQVPIERLGRPEEVAHVVQFLVSDAASYVNGQVWAVNGGMYM